MVIPASLFHPSACIVGESPLWHAGRNTCFWVDIEGRSIYEASVTGQSLASWPMDTYISLVVPAGPDHLLLGLQGGIALLHLPTGKRHWLTNMGLDWNGLRCNDGACDSQGRLWIGTTEVRHREGAGALYSIDKKMNVQQKIGGLTIPNGMAWSPDDAQLYFTDTVSGEIGSYVYDAAAGAIVFGKCAIRIPPEMGLPDGMAMDAEGKLWIALWGGYGVGRWDPLTGRQLAFVKVPAPQVSSCAFAGEDLDRLIITTARRDLTPGTLEEYPLSGHTFIAEPGVKGMPCHPCGIGTIPHPIEENA